jgi:hypothetical protein
VAQPFETFSTACGQHRQYASNYLQLSATIGYIAEPYGNLTLYGCNIAGHAPATQLQQHIAGKYCSSKRTLRITL